MDQTDLNSALDALLAKIGALQSKADGLIKDIEARPFQVMCREKGITPEEVLAKVESQMGADELNESRSAIRNFKKECEEQVRRELGMQDPAAAHAKRSPRRFV
jgi:hypothetical protein